MKHKFSLMTLALSATCLLLPPVAGAASASTDPQATQNDRQILEWIIVLDKNEIAAAKVTANKKVDPAVKNYAKMLQQSHSENLAQTIKLSKAINEKPMDSVDSKTMKQNGQKEIAKLKKLNGSEYQTTFVNAMVKGHTDALQKIDNDLMSKVTNPELKKQLKMTRDEVEQHLDEGKKLQAG